MQAGFQHKVLAMHNGPNIESVTLADVNILFVPASIEIFSLPMSAGYARQFSEQIRSADILHYHFPFPFADLLHLLLRPTQPCLVSYHSDIVRQRFSGCLYRPLMNHFLSRVDRIIAASDNYRLSSHALKDHKDKVETIPYGLDPSSYPPVNTAVAEQLQAKLGNHFFLFVGALRYYKGLPYLIEAARISGLPVVIAGEGRIEKQLRQQSSGITNIHWLGPVNEVEKIALLHLCRAFVYPSHLRAEAFGISLLEAALCGRPMISAEIGTGTSFVNQHGVTGLVVPPADADALANAMTLLAKNGYLAEQLGHNAQSRFDALFNANKMIQAYHDLYWRLLNHQSMHEHT